MAEHPGEQPRHFWTMVAPAIAVVVSVGLPMFMVGSFSVRMESELGFGSTELGYVVGTFFFSASVASTFMGRIVQRFGWSNGFRIACVCSVASLLGVALLVHTWPVLAAMMVIGGVGVSAAHPAVNLAIVRRVDMRRQGLVFGMKQGAMTGAGLLAGIAVPIIALTIGWRWGFAIAALLPVSLLFRQSNSEAGARPDAPTGRLGPRERRTLIAIAAATACAASAGNSAGAFFVQSIVKSGVHEGVAGIMLAACAICGVSARVGVGWWADRSGQQPLRIASTMLLLGCPGFILLSTHTSIASLLGGMVAFGLGWGWPGLIHQAAATVQRDAAAAATGILQVGGFIGGSLGPILFGFIATSASFAVAWRVAAGMALLASMILLASQRHLERTINA